MSVLHFALVKCFTNFRAEWGRAYVRMHTRPRTNQHTFLVRAHIDAAQVDHDLDASFARVRSKPLSAVSEAFHLAR